ncbi:hypothetical protein, conserved [Babesia bigemina]|uniref:RRM domain-containing protein n=1 Tax=Babesia bigemina TaxID=5866 RepID=A0A061DC52_BABBI|nr:hypothetical protein, conserved [Babesia bigemina]CDR95335.1 hypothetical protein, conserved [Babesia bigemina]|eukprot:XP_012767521.1 hypothetical protein, conserved [Babesia bigemina]
MTNHAYASDNVGVIADPNIFPMMFAGPLGPSCAHFHGIPTPFLPVAPNTIVNPYQINFGDCRNSSQGWKDKGGQRRAVTSSYRKNVPDARVHRGRPYRPPGATALRAALFIEYAKSDFHLVESDLEELFSHFGGASKIDVKNDVAAAEVTLADGAAGRAAIEELNGLNIPNVGILRCVELHGGETLDRALSKAQLFEQRQSAKPYNAPRGADARVTHTNAASDTKCKRVARLELIELFTYEPEFNVTATILGPNNNNIKFIMRNSGGNVDIAITGKPLNSAPVCERLHISVSSRDYPAYLKALDMLEDLLTTVCEKFVEFVRSRGKVVSNLVGFKRHEYQEINGNLEYKGVTEKWKSWLNKRCNASPYKTNNVNRPPSKRVNDRSRGISRTPPVPKSNMRSVK